MIHPYFTEPTGLSAVIPEYRIRPGQIEAAELIHESLEHLRHAVIEAPTGSGKTFSYLVPAFEKGARTIISTKTKQLMRQLMEKDIAAMQKLFGRDIFVTTLKGRKNYFCPYRFYRFIYPDAAMFPDAVEWFEKNMNEFILEVPWGRMAPEAADRMSADSMQCRYSKCEFIEQCSFYRARDRANGADIVITNHHLLLSDIAAKAKGGHGSIFELTDHIIFDEAHSILDIFPLYSGVELNLFGIPNIVKENKEFFDFGDIDRVERMYYELHESMKESRLRYDQIDGRIREFFEISREVIESSGDDDVKDEFTRIEKSMKVFSSDVEGVRLVDKRERALTMRFIPLDVSREFSDGLKAATLSAVFISATMTAGRDFDYFLRETGLQHHDVTKKAFPPVFNLEEKGRLYVPKLTTPEMNDRFYYELANRAPGSILVICNSVGRMEYLSKMLDEREVAKPVYTQLDVDFSELDGSDDVVLIGCALLREGIDLARAGFTCVVLDKLPFEYPHDVFLREKAKKVEEELGDGFTDFFLPRAVLFFKQAVGRLLRHEDDRGLWIVPDRRILTKNYGKYFLDVLQKVSRVDSFHEALGFLEERHE